MEFSIIVPIYKVEEYIERCVDSLRNQTFSDIEIILVDDGSDDNCPKICDSYAQTDSRIKVIHKENGGLSDARNFGLNAATGEYVIFVDSDDYVEPDMCDVFHNVIKNTHADVIVGDAIVHNKKQSLSHDKIPQLKVYTGLEYLKLIYTVNQNSMAAWLNVYRREFLLKNDLKFKKGILHEDEEFTPRVLLKASSVVYSGKEFYHYIVRENSITTKKDLRKNADDLYSTCCELEKLYYSIEDIELRSFMLNSLADKQLNMFQMGRMYQYGKEYIYKEFVKRNAKIKRTVMKAYLYVFSPRLYYLINKQIKNSRFGEKL